MNRGEAQYEPDEVRRDLFLLCFTPIFHFSLSPLLLHAYLFFPPFSSTLTHFHSMFPLNHQEMAFIPRQVPLTPGTAGGMAVFVVFLISFTGLTMLERNDGVFFFAEHTRQLIGVDDFRRLEGHHHTYREYLLRPIETP